MTGRRVLALALAAVLLFLVLAQPNHPGAATWGALRVVPLELPAIALGLAALGDGRAGRVARGLLAALLLATVLLKLADLATFSAFGRRFNPVFDLHLAPAGARLLAGVLGFVPAVLVGVGALLVLAALGGLILWALRAWSRAGLGRRGRVVGGAAALAFGAVALAELGLHAGAWTIPNPPGSAFTTRVLAEHATGALRSRAEFAAFARAAADDPLAGRDGLMGRLDGRDVLVVFVESYGRASLDNPLYAPTHRATLAAAEPALAAAGLEARSGWLASPIMGGQSWLAHATLASGLRIGDQRRYGALLASPRRTLWDLARGAGYHTAAVMPANVLPWPEGQRLGFDTRLGAADLGYRGQPFNWVTMPDQYTLSAFRGRIDTGGRPLFAQVALISSHAPWTPVPRLVPWDAVGDGRIFDAARYGDPPEVVWADDDRVREQYRLSIDYALRAVLSFAALPREGPPLLVVMGDHPAAGFVEQTGSPAVPVHLIGHPALLDAFDAWGWAPGLVPDPDLPAWPMEAFRDRFVGALTAPGEQGT